MIGISLKRIPGIFWWVLEDWLVFLIVIEINIMLDWSGIREIDLVMPSLLLLRKSWNSVLFHCWMLERRSRNGKRSLCMERARRRWTGTMVNSEQAQNNTQKQHRSNREYVSIRGSIAEITVQGFAESYRRLTISQCLLKISKVHLILIVKHTCLSSKIL